jgi:hypothetical protein
MPPQVSQQGLTPRSTTTTSRIASSGSPRKASWRRSSRIKAMASAKFCRHSSRVWPWPLAPAISGQYAIYQSPSRSMIAVNSLRIWQSPMLMVSTQFLIHSGVGLPDERKSSPPGTARNTFMSPETRKAVSVRSSVWLSATSRTCTDDTNQLAFQGLSGAWTRLCKTHSHRVQASIHSGLWCPLAKQRHSSLPPACPRAYWITSSARRSRDAGIVSPSAWAVLRLRTNANCIGCSTGRSPGFAPWRILST